MRDEPADLAPDQVAAALSTYWGIEADLEYAPVGHGGYHWTARERSGGQWFVTADPRVGKAFDQVLAGYQTAARLRSQGLEFVHTPTPDRSGQLWRRIAPGWAISVARWLDGRQPDYWTAERVQVAGLVGRLHAYSPAPDGTPSWEPPDHAEPVHDLLGTLDKPWADGPYGESARRLLVRSTAGIEALLRHLEQLIDRLEATDEPWVITHGEPHAGDVLVDESGGMHLIDWDDICLAPRERDLRILLHGHHHAPLAWDNDDVVAAYQRTAGPFQPRDFVLELFRADWALAAVRSSQLLQQPHHDTADTAARLRELAFYLPVEQNWPGLG